VCRADQCIGPGPEFGNSRIPAGNCGPVSSDIHMFDGHVCILYKFMFYIYMGEQSEWSRERGAAVAGGAKRLDEKLKKSYQVEKKLCRHGGAKQLE
jgi:hypothetical protein